jgi:RES domain-containing protein
MGRAWRIVKEKYASSAFSGEGAARSAGRWNSRGTWVVYASGSVSLAALETLVHLNPPIAFLYTTFRIDFDDALVERIDPLALPPTWRDSPASGSTQGIGDVWVKEARSAVLEVPSVLVTGECNFLLNPAHREFRSIQIEEAGPFSFDPRLLR